jgi:hypothetical protein
MESKQQSCGTEFDSILESLTLPKMIVSLKLYCPAKISHKEHQNVHEIEYKYFSDQSHFCQNVRNYYHFIVKEIVKRPFFIYSPF